MEIAKMLVVSTGHLTRSEADALHEFSRGETGIMLAIDQKERKFITAGALQNFSTGARSVLEKAMSRDCQYVLFDRDGDYLDGVDTHHW